MVVTALMIAAAVAVLAGIAVVSTGRGGELAPPRSVPPSLELPPERSLVPEDLERVRFSTSLWGYPPAQVEELLDRVARALAERDAHIADLEHRMLARQLGAARSAGPPEGSDLASSSDSRAAGAAGDGASTPRGVYKDTRRQQERPAAPEDPGSPGKAAGSGGAGDSSSGEPS